MSNYSKLNYNFDTDRLAAESLELFSKHVSGGQISLKHRKDTAVNDRWEDGIGSAFGAGQIIDTKKFTELNERLKGSYLEKVHDVMAKDYNFSRVRLMKLTGKTCLTWHVDLEKRIHIPILTNDKCLVIVDDEVFRLPANGNAYLVDTTKPHTVLNGNLNFDRIHLIFDLL